MLISFFAAMTSKYAILGRNKSQKWLRIESTSLYVCRIQVGKDLRRRRHLGSRFGSSRRRSSQGNTEEGQSEGGDTSLEMRLKIVD